MFNLWNFITSLFWTSEDELLHDLKKEIDQNIYFEFIDL